MRALKVSRIVHQQRGADIDPPVEDSQEQLGQNNPPREKEKKNA